MKEETQVDGEVISLDGLVTGVSVALFAIFTLSFVAALVLSPPVFLGAASLSSLAGLVLLTGATVAITVTKSKKLCVAVGVIGLFLVVIPPTSFFLVEKVRENSSLSPSAEEWMPPLQPPEFPADSKI